MRLMNAADNARRRRAVGFQVLIVSDLDRLGREQLETGYLLKQLSLAGVRVFTYLDDREILLDSPTATFLMQAQSFGAALKREKARQRTYDAMQRKAKAGHVTGGRVFGYDNVAVDGHVRRAINEPEAAVARRIFELCASCVGVARTAKLLNGERAVAPRPQQARPAGWSPSTVRDILHRELYRGVIVWNRSRKRDAWGQHRQQARPTSEWLRVEAPSLRVVSDELWNAARERLRGIRQRLATAQGGRPIVRRDVDSRYLLSGFAR